MLDLSEKGIIKLISQGESETVEFKLKLPHDRAIAQNLSAFANCNGGVLFVGVNDYGEPVGLSDEDVGKTMDRLTQIASSIFQWPIEIGVVDVNGKSIIYAHVDRAPKYYWPVITSTGTFYIRDGADNSKLSETDLSNFFKGTEEATIQVPCTDKLIVFVAMSFRDEQEPSLEDYFKAMERAGKRVSQETTKEIKILRMDLVEGDYEISQAIMDEIDKSDIVLSDFTLNSSNVYFELGYARGKGKHVIQTARKETKLEFDVRNWRTLFYRNATELEEKLFLELQAICNK